MKKVLLLLTMLFMNSTFAFTPIFLQTDNFKIKTSREFSKYSNPDFCKFETRMNEKKQVIEIRAGVVGSPVDFFGWNMNIPLSDFPLKKDYRRVFKPLGVTGMVLTYDGTTLKFERNDKNERITNRIYSFSVVIDSELLKPKQFKGTMKGYDRTILGTLKKHVDSSCKWN